MSILIKSTSSSKLSNLIDTPVSGKRRNIIDEKLGSRIISEFNNGYSSLQLEKNTKLTTILF